MEGENVIYLTGQEWEETPIPQPEQVLGTKLTPTRVIESPTPRFTLGIRNSIGCLIVAVKVPKNY